MVDFILKVCVDSVTCTNFVTKHASINIVFIHVVYMQLYRYYLCQKDSTGSQLLIVMVKSIFMTAAFLDTCVQAQRSNWFDFIGLQ